VEALARLAPDPVLPGAASCPFVVRRTARGRGVDGLPSFDQAVYRRAMDTAPTPALMKEINDAFNSRDVDRIMTFFADDCTFLMARGPEAVGRRVHGKEAVRRVLAERFKVIPDMRWDHVDGFVHGHRAVSVWKVTGLGKDGERLDYRGCDIYEFRGDKILNKDTYWKLVEQVDRL
jgi:ketosteroid isomerase-like protein